MKNALRVSVHILSAIVCFFILGAGCSKKEVKRVTEDSRVTTEAFEVIERVREAYTAQNLKALEGLTTREGYRTIISAYKGFDSADLTFNPVLVELEAGDVYVNVSWKGQWKRGGKTTEERGMAVFLLKGKPLRVDNILRTNPFQ